MDTMPLPEVRFFTDDPRFLAEMLKKEWSLDTINQPLSVGFEPEQFMTNARIGHVYIYEVSHNARPSTTDYRTLDRESHVSIRVATRFRDVHYVWVNEVYRILMANRRAGVRRLNGYTHMEISVDRPYNDASGWYVTNIDVKMIMPHMPIMSPGFGKDVNDTFAKALHRDDE